VVKIGVGVGGRSEELRVLANCVRFLSRFSSRCVVSDCIVYYTEGSFRIGCRCAELEMRPTLGVPGRLPKWR